MEVGLAGHCVAVGDFGGNLYIMTTKILDQVSRLKLPEKVEMGTNLYYRFKSDETWSNGVELI